MFEDRFIEISFLTCVVDAKVATIVADESGDDDDEKSEGPAGLKSHNWKDKYESSDHAIDNAEDSHGSRYVLTFFCHRKAIEDLKYMEGGVLIWIGKIIDKYQNDRGDSKMDVLMPLLLNVAGLIIIWLLEDMPRKTKQIQKEEKEEKVEVSAKKGNKKESSNDWDIFSDGFKDRLNQFISLNSEVTDLKSSV